MPVSGFVFLNLCLSVYLDPSLLAYPLKLALIFFYQPLVHTNTIPSQTYILRLLVALIRHVILIDSCKIKPH